jgi:hypothetical protein
MARNCLSSLQLIVLVEGQLAGGELRRRQTVDIDLHEMDPSVPVRSTRPVANVSRNRSVKRDRVASISFYSTIVNTCIVDNQFFALKEPCR